MKKKALSKKLVFNKITVAQLNQGELNRFHGGRPVVVPMTVTCNVVYTETCYCTGIIECQNSRYGDTTCIFTNYQDMNGCPVTMTLCGQLYCP